MRHLSAAKNLVPLCTGRSGQVGPDRVVVTATTTITASTTSATSTTSCTKRSFAQVKDLDNHQREIWFTSYPPVWKQRSGLGIEHHQVDERTLQLGKTVRELHTRLPTLLQSPLPSDILSSQITLHLFPSTHPHLPTVSGRIGYVAALWTAPVAWGQIPLIGNVKLSILSERMMKGVASGSGDEKLVVKWKTCAKGGHRDATGGKYRDAGIGARDPVERIKSFLGARKSEARDEEAKEADEFCGIFIFEFDASGRIVKHVIEHTEHGEHWDKTNRVVSVTDWLLGKFNGSTRNEVPALAFCKLQQPGPDIHTSRLRRPYESQG